MAGAPAVSARYIVGDCLEQLRKLDDNSVDLVFSSPPFLALRSYLPADHPDKAKEIGSEPTPGDFIDTLLDVVEECARVLAPHGSLCFELGDTYSGSGGAGGDYGDDGLRKGQPKFRQGTPRWDGRPEGQIRTTTSDPVVYPARARSDWSLPKSLALIPESFRWALAYGRNPFNGRTTEPWRVRNVVRWHRPNPPVGALGDKFRPSTSDVVVACKSAKRYFDLDAVRTEHQQHNYSLQTKRIRSGPDEVNRNHGRDEYTNNGNSAGAPPLDTWIIPTAPYKGSHYATFPPALVIKPVLSMCPERVCVVCGEPSRRIVEATQFAERPDGSLGPKGWHPPAPESQHNSGHDQGYVRMATTTGWTRCSCDAAGRLKWRNGVVLDPFAGSGTTLAVATGHGRDAIGIDLDERNAHLAQERVGMFLTVEWPENAALETP